MIMGIMRIFKNFRRKSTIKQVYHSFKFMLISTIIESVGATSEGIPNNGLDPMQRSNYHSLGYDLFIYGSVTLSFILAWKLLKIYRNSITIPIYDASKGHHWVSFQLPPMMVSNVVFCNVCKGLIVDGLYCDYCGICADSSKCHHSADTQIPCKLSYTRIDESITFHRHHWVQGNISCQSNCIVCGDDIDEKEDVLQDFRCCWCQRTVHETESCYNQIANAHCDSGKYGKYIIPPESIKCQSRWLRGRSQVIWSIDSTKPTENWQPLIVFGNRKSGNNDGANVLRAFRYVLNRCQVIDLADGSPEQGLYWCKALSKSHPDVVPIILVAAGDGTVAWILQTIDKMKLSPVPMVGIIPLGTGNDLAQVLGWGASFNSDSSLRFIMDCLEKSKCVLLDRWSVKISPPTFGLLFTYKSLVMNNYLSIGVDALVALNFHQTRESKYYSWFGSRLFNKFLYFSYGTKDLLEHKCSQLEQKIHLELDGVKQDLPELESIVILNIPSWGGGKDIWSIGKNSESSLPDQKIDDQLIEVLGITSSFHIAQMMVGLSEPLRIGRAKTVLIKLFDKLPMQVDGEPWIQHPCNIKIDWLNQAKMLKVPVKE